MSWLPSKRFLVVLAALVVIGGVVGITTVRNPKETSENIATNDNAHIVPERQPLLATDSDNDNLKDWEEALWQTDPENPDSDGDGTSDGVEVTAERDPTVPGPDDARGNDAPTSATTPYSSFQELAGAQTSTTETERLSRTLFAAYLDQQQSGSAVNPETLATRIIQSLQTQTTDNASLTQYTVNDLLVSPQQDASALRAYANAVGRVFQGTATKENNELLALEAFAQTGDPSELNLEPVAEAYASRAAALRAITVPSPLVLEHLTMLNALSGIGESMQGFALLEHDPLLALVALQRYEVYSNELQGAVAAIGAFLGNAGIVFAGNEPGIVLTL